MVILDHLFDKPETVELRAVYDDDLSEYLESLDLLGQVQSGEITCAVCNDLISEENIGAFVPGDDKIQIICDKPSCLNEARLWR